MPGFEAVHAEIDAVRAAATTLRGCAAALEQQSRRITEHAFGAHGDQAGRNYAAQAAAIHDGFERIAACLHNWGASATATADVFDHAATEYARIDRERAAATAGALR